MAGGQRRLSFPCSGAGSFMAFGADSSTPGLFVYITNQSSLKPRPPNEDSPHFLLCSSGWSVAWNWRREPLSCCLSLGGTRSSTVCLWAASFSSLFKILAPQLCQGWVRAGSICPPLNHVGGCHSPFSVVTDSLANTKPVFIFCLLLCFSFGFLILIEKRHYSLPSLLVSFFFYHFILCLPSASWLHPSFIWRGVGRSQSQG